MSIQPSRVSVSEIHRFKATPLRARRLGRRGHELEPSWFQDWGSLRRRRFGRSRPPAPPSGSDSPAPQLPSRAAAPPNQRLQRVDSGFKLRRLGLSGIGAGRRRGVRAMEHRIVGPGPYRATRLVSVRAGVWAKRAPGLRADRGLVSTRFSRASLTEFWRRGVFPLVRPDSR